MAKKKGWRYVPARVAALVFMVMCLAMMTMAFQAPAAAQPSMLSLVGKMAMSGAIAALIGWGAQPKEADGTHEDWDWAQLPLTVFIGAGFGVYAALTHTTLASAENQGWTPFVIMGLEHGVKLIFRNAKVSVQRAFETTKAGTGQNPTALPPTTPPKPS